MTNVVTSDEFDAWYGSLDAGDVRAVNRVIDLLKQAGVTLRHPYSSQIHGSRINMRELRIQSMGRPLRVMYTFDSARNAVVLTGGDKTGDDRFYERAVREAEKIYADYFAQKPKK